MLRGVFVILVGLAGPLAASLPEVSVGHQDGCLQFQMPHTPGLKEVFFNYILSSLSSLVPHTGKAIKGIDGVWYLKTEKVNLNPGDSVQFSVSAWGTMGKIQSSVSNWVYAPTPALGPRRTRGAVVFRDDFNGAELDRNRWKYEISMFGGYNWEFQVYCPEKSNVFLRGGNLYLKPTKTVDDPKFDEHYLTNGVMDMTELWGECTQSGNYGCRREGKYGMLPPVMSGKVTTRPTIRFGTVEVRARIPKGDWIWPAIWMLPSASRYGGWPRSGEIDIMESRGNVNARSSDGRNHGVNEISSTLHWGASTQTNKYMLTHAEKQKNGGDWHDSFHTWRLDWTPDHIITTVDNQEILRVTPPSGGFYALGGHQGENPWGGASKMAPFDQDFFLILNVAVGGTVGFFPDNFNYGVQKPWLNTSPHANADFWARRGDWERTWSGDNAAMEIDYIEMRHL